MITIVDYQVGNVGSVANMLRRAGTRYSITGDPAQVARADRLILPGVGSFDHGMKQLAALGLDTALHQAVRDRRVPILGICLGSQLMARRSEEGDLPGLGWLDATVARFSFVSGRDRLPLPHMGWCEVEPAPAARLFRGLDPRPRFYFVHSYHLVCAEERDCAATATYGYPFAAAIERENLFGVQFHPEKSHRFGLGLLGSFANLGS